MSNIISFETAKELKEAGFPQPEPAIGQVWYGTIGGQSDINLIVRRSPNGDRPFIDSYGNYHGQESFKKFGIYAPTVDDLLRELPDHQLCYSVSGSFWCQKPDHLGSAIIGFSSHSKADSLVEACAMEWIKLNKS